MIFEWWATLSVASKVLWAVTLSASLVFVIELVMSFIGIGGDADFDMPDDMTGDVSADLDSAHGGGSNLYTFRNLINFILGFGWTMILMQDQVKSTGLLIFIAILVGVGLVALVMYMFKWLSSMQQSGTINLAKSAAGCHGKVYLAVPAQRAGTGKVQITINSSVRDYDAVTDNDQPLTTGQAIKVIDVVDGNTLLVEPQDAEII